MVFETMSSQYQILGLLLSPEANKYKCVFLNFSIFLLGCCALCNRKFLTIAAHWTEMKLEFIALDLHLLVVVFIVLGIEAVEDGSSEGEDGGSPGQAVAPVKLMVHPQCDRLDELDGEQNQAAHLEHHCKNKTTGKRENALKKFIKTD